MFLKKIIFFEQYRGYNLLYSEAGAVGAWHDIQGNGGRYMELQLVNEWVKSAEGCFAAGDIASMRACGRQMLEESPGNPVAMALIAEASVYMQDFQEAESWLEKMDQAVDKGSSQGWKLDNGNLRILFAKALYYGAQYELSLAMEAYEKLFQKGEATVIDRNKAHQAFLFFKTEYDEFLTTKENLLNELKALNGGNAVEINDTAFIFSPMSNDFDAWLSQNIGLHPEIMLAEGELKAEKQSLKVAKGSRIPGLKIGYTGEFTREEKYQGPTIGLSLPLWGSGRKVKVAKLHVEAAEKSLEDTRLNLTTQLRGIYREALHLQDTYLRYKKHLTECDNSELLKKSLDSGQITLLEYLQERQFVHEMHEKILIAERDLALRKAELIF